MLVLHNPNYGNYAKSNYLSSRITKRIIIGINIPYFSSNGVLIPFQWPSKREWIDNAIVNVTSNLVAWNKRQATHEQVDPDMTSNAFRLIFQWSSQERKITIDQSAKQQPTRKWGVHSLYSLWSKRGAHPSVKHMHEETTPHLREPIQVLITCIEKCATSKRR